MTLHLTTSPAACCLQFSSHLGTYQPTSAPDIAWQDSERPHFVPIGSRRNTTFSSSSSGMTSCIFSPLPPTAMKCSYCSDSSPSNTRLSI
eukprot:898041-Rhodomonas_salina.3